MTEVTDHTHLRTTKAKIKKNVLHQTMKRLHSKGNHEQNKIHSTEWEKYICTLFVQWGVNIQNMEKKKQLIEFNIKNKQTKTKQNKTKKHLIKEWAEDMNRHISKWDIQMANGHMKIFSTSLIIRWKQTKTGMRHHPTSVKTAIIKKIRNNKYVDVMKKRESVIPSVSECSHYGKQSGDSLKSKNRTTI